ncbi:MAG: hypothetical protein KDE47_31895, partial [Caldilineaceae bacterium]|nr:hypothetical protein [Caldilineaceae bacterium]
ILELPGRNAPDEQHHLRIEAEFVGDDGAVAHLLNTLVHANIPILSFTETAGDLEEIFLQLTEPQ